MRNRDVRSWRANARYPERSARSETRLERSGRNRLGQDPPLREPHSGYRPDLRGALARGCCRSGACRARAWVTATGTRQAPLDGIDLHANVHVAADNRDGLEQLARYVLRPPIAQSR
jgi:hypothetical protein